MIDNEPSCGGPPKTEAGIRCPRGYVAVTIDPKTMAVTELARGPATPAFTGTAIAMRVGNELWLGLVLRRPRWRIGRSSRADRRRVCRPRTYAERAGSKPALPCSCRRKSYRLPPVLFAIDAPPGRDRLVVLPLPEAWSLEAFV